MIGGAKSDDMASAPGKSRTIKNNRKTYTPVSDVNSATNVDIAQSGIPMSVTGKFFSK